MPQAASNADNKSDRIKNTSSKTNSNTQAIVGATIAGAASLFASGATAGTTNTSQANRQVTAYGTGRTQATTLTSISSASARSEAANSAEAGSSAAASFKLPAKNTNSGKMPVGAKTATAANSPTVAAATSSTNTQAQQVSQNTQDSSNQGGALTESQHQAERARIERENPRPKQQNTHSQSASAHAGSQGGASQNSSGAKPGGMPAASNSMRSQSDDPRTLPFSEDMSTLPFPEEVTTLPWEEPMPDPSPSFEEILPAFLGIGIGVGGLLGVAGYNIARLIKGPPKGPEAKDIFADNLEEKKPQLDDGEQKRAASVSGSPPVAQQRRRSISGSPPFSHRPRRIPTEQMNARARALVANSAPDSLLPQSMIHLALLMKVSYLNDEIKKNKFYKHFCYFAQTIPFKKTANETGDNASDDESEFFNEEKIISLDETFFEISIGKFTMILPSKEAILCNEALFSTYLKIHIIEPMFELFLTNSLSIMYFPPQLPSFFLLAIIKEYILIANKYRENRALIFSLGSHYNHDSIRSLIRKNAELTLDHHVSGDKYVLIKKNRPIVNRNIPPQRGSQQPPSILKSSVYRDLLSDLIDQFFSNLTKSQPISQPVLQVSANQQKRGISFASDDKLCDYRLF